MNDWLDRAYRFLQSIYASGFVSRMIQSVRAWMDARTSAQMVAWLIGTALWVVAVGMLIDAALYWTREDQSSRALRLYRRIRAFWRRNMARLARKEP